MVQCNKHCLYIHIIGAIFTNEQIIYFMEHNVLFMLNFQHMFSNQKE